MGIPLTHFLSLIVMRCSFLDSIYSSFLPPSLSSSINRMRDLFSNLETVSTDLRRKLPDRWIVNAKLVAYSADQILCKLQQLLLDRDADMASNLLGSSEIDEEINWVIRVLEELLVSGEIKIGYSGVLTYINPGLSEQEVGKLLYSGNPSQPWSEIYKLLMKPSVLMDVPESVNGFFNPIYNRRLKQVSPFTLITSLHLSGLSGFVELPRLPVLQCLRISGCERLNAVSICEKLSAVEALEISCCPELTSLAGLNQLLSLRSLSLSFCFKLQFDLHVQLPPLLEYLDLTHCPSLEEWCQNAGLQNRKLDETIESFQRSSPVGDSPVYGRENEKNLIIEFLLSDDFIGNNLTVVCIVGESGIGKTSLAHLIYSEERVLDSFDARMLITMPEKSDETRLIKKLIESVTSSSCPMTEADLLEELLIDELSGTKVFVVLDDAENENPCFWNRIITILNHSTRGSVLLVTTKSKDVAEVIGASQTYYLNPLPDYYCWKIFWQHIFTGLNTDANTDLVETGKQLLSKCQNNPLCIKVLAGLLVCLKNEKSLVEILKTDLWNMDGFDGDTLPTLRVGYELLPNELKKCLHYCSLFPKDYAFAKQQIVHMWMSQGFIISMEGRQPEEVGLQYFDELLLRGFFQHSPLHDVEEDKFIMHDLIRALATNLSRKSGPPAEDALERIFENCFHFSLNPSKIQMDEMKPLRNSDLQSFLALTSFSLQTRINMSILDITSLSDLFTKCINIRTLDLSCTDIVELPSSVGMLKQLRYLGVNNTKIRSIPRELCSLVSLQTLEAKDCQHLVELPESMMELTNLRHLDVSKKSGCVKMMIGIGQLTNLQSLAVFCVGCEMPYCSIRELKDLNCLSSCLQIAGLENIRYGLDAQEAALHNKVHLNTLWLHWNDNTTCIESAESVTISEEVLKNLKPNPNIGELIIRNYRGNLFPTWMGDPSFSKLVSIILDKCLNCSQFPALGGLPSLRHLSVQKLYHLVRLENTDSQFVLKNTPKFPSLETLNLWEMYDLEELFETSDCDFPCLRTLSISRCPMLKRVPCFSSLLNLSLYCCVKLPHLPDFPSLESLRIDGFQKIKSLELPKDLPALKELEIRHCNELLLVEGLPKLPSLKKLNVVHCPKSGSLKNWKPHHSKPISTTRWFFPKEESTTQMEHQETSEPAEDGQIDLISSAPTGCSATVQHSTVNSGLPIQSTQLVGTPPNDGYTWRKYGQKSIKSSLSSHYYICTYPDCPAKKKVQWDDHDQISEIVCKGIHTHARSPNRCYPGYSSVPEVNNSSTMDGSISGLSVSKREREPSGEDTNDKQPKVHKSDLGLTRRSPRMQIESPTPSLYRLIFKCPPNFPIYTSTNIIEAPTPSLYRLIFKCPPKLPIYTGTKIEDIEGKPLQILLVAGPNGSPMSLPSPIKIELVVLDGDFPSDGTDDWTSEEFKKYVVKERAGKRPLLTGDVSNITMRDGKVSISELQFTDNSSWIRSRNFRIAVRVVEGSYEGPRIREAMTDKFVVRDNRGELYRKRYPPSLHDEVWRLEKIGKDGAFHRKLHERKISNVQEFLQLLNVDPIQLRQILGPGMSDKMWEITVNHAKTCCAGEKIYSHSSPNATVFLNSICEILSVTIDGINYYSLQELPRNHKNYVLQLVKEAYEQWGNLRETDGDPNASLALIQSETVIQSPAGTLPWYPANQEDFLIGGFDEDGASTSF